MFKLIIINLDLNPNNSYEICCSIKNLFQDPPIIIAYSAFLNKLENNLNKIDFLLDLPI